MCTPLSNTVAQFRHCQNDRRPKSEMVEVSSSASRRHDTGSANNPTKFGLADWYPVHVSLERALTAGRVDPAWAEQRKAQWGEHSPLYANRVLGEFKADDEEGVIPLAWVEAAVERWTEHQDVALGPLTTVGVDVARSGNDKTIMALRHGDRLHELRETFHEDTMMTTGRLVGILGAHLGAVGIVDADGLGAGVFDRAREQGRAVTAFHAAAQTPKKDRSKELSFVNVRAAAWWGLRELLDPAYDPVIELPPDDLLLGELTAPIGCNHRTDACRSSPRTPSRSASTGAPTGPTPSSWPGGKITSVVEPGWVIFG